MTQVRRGRDKDLVLFGLNGFHGHRRRIRCCCGNISRFILAGLRNVCATVLCCYSCRRCP